MVVVPMAVSLSFGLMLATALVLILGPVLYLLVAGGQLAPLEDEEDEAPAEGGGPAPEVVVPGGVAVSAPVGDRYKDL